MEITVIEKVEDTKEQMSEGCDDIFFDKNVAIKQGLDELQKGSLYGNFDVHVERKFSNNIEAG